jgi:hypothetical protein
MRSNKLVFGVLAVAGLAAAYWFLLLAPKREESAALERQVAVKQQEVTAAEATLASYRQARDTYKVTYARVTRLGKAVPADDDVRSLVVQLDAASKTAKVNFQSISATGTSAASTEPAGAPTGAAAPPPGAVQSSSAGFSTMPFALSFSGDYGHLSSLFSELERFVAVDDQKIDVKGRLMRVDSIVLTPRPGELKTGLQAQVNASTFLVPETEGVSGAAATPASPGAATASTPTSAAVTGAIE